MDQWLQNEEEEGSIYPYIKTFEEGRNEPFVAVHTSGSTGIPKLVVMTHGTMATLDAYQSIPSLGGQPVYSHYLRGTRMFTSFPLFHAAGILIALPMNIYNEIVIVLPPPGPTTAEVADLIHVYGNVQGSSLPPSIISDIVQEMAYLDNVQNLQYVTYAGGPLAKDTGDIMARRTRVMNMFGASELGILPMELADADDWEYLCISPFLGHEYRFRGDGLYELIIIRNEKLFLFQGIFSTFPELQEYPTKDLFSKHPTKPGYWRYIGRSDDVIVYSNGEKFNPVTMEGLVSSHPAVSSALVYGQGRFQSSLLVQPKNIPMSDEDRRDLLDEIWPTIHRANEISPAHSRVIRPFITFTAADKPMLQSGKGTVQRKMTLDLYRKELDALYELNAADTPFETPTAPINSNQEPLRDSLYRLITTSMGLDDIDNAADLFQLGMDSLQVTDLVRLINGFLAKLGKDYMPITAKTIYSVRTIQKLELALENSMAKGEPNGIPSVVGEKDRYQKMEEILVKYSLDLPITARPVFPYSKQHFVVLLTGSTGSLGSYLLDSMIRDPDICRVYCLNRGSDAEKRQKESHLNKGLSVEFKNVAFLQSDLAQPYFGLPPSIYASLLQDVTHIVHNAWKVDFNHSIESFITPYIYSVRQLIDFSSRSAHGALIFFISTIGAVMSWNSNHKGKVPEQIVEDWTVPQEMGYAESKHVAEKLLATAAREARIQSVICRVGQIAGPTTIQGMWNKQEWLPSIIASSIHLGLLPASLGPMEIVDWIPVDVLAQIITELMKTSTNRTPTVVSQATGSAEEVTKHHHIFSDNHHLELPLVYHTVNPSKILWSDILPSLQSRFSMSVLDVVPLPSWIDALRRSYSDTDNVSQNPALKLLDFLEDLEKQSSAGLEPVVLETINTEKQSQTMAALGPISQEWVDNWIRQWQF